MGKEEQVTFICKDVVENIIDYIEAELDAETLRMLEEHVEECPECMEFIRTYRKMLELSGRLKERTFVTPEVRRRLIALLKSKVRPE